MLSEQFFSETIAKSLKGSKNFQGFALIWRQDYLLLFHDKKNCLLNSFQIQFD